MDINKYIDHTNLKSTTTDEEIVKLCHEAKENNFKAVCVNPSYVKLAKRELADSEAVICTVIGFPLGANLTEIKCIEASKAVEDGATEIDMVINIGYLKSKNYEYVKRDIEEVVIASKNNLVKVILETCYLDEFEIKRACEISMEAGADFVKTSTGFGTAGAKLEDIKLMKEIVGEKMKIKASGGIKSFETALSFINAGADRIGTSSGVTIVNEVN